ncbi:MAG TPA: cyclic nucleotide-binding domain-containing protein [Streptosporangiaceae bacterium]|nr:cyclic nucleotide-binding domain-containing protein [Streptosporangiaceae bacterium]
MIEVTAEALATHPFLHNMSRDHLAMLAQTASDVTFPARHRLFEDGGGASRFWLIQSGHVALDLHVPGQGRMTIDTIGMGELLGWSWLFPPYRWAFGAVAAGPVEAFEFDGRAVRACGGGRGGLRLGCLHAGRRGERIEIEPAADGTGLAWSVPLRP